MSWLFDRPGGANAIKQLEEYVEKVKCLEKERNALKQQLKDLQGGDCMKLAAEIDRLKEQQIASVNDQEAKLQREKECISKALADKDQQIADAVARGKVLAREEYQQEQSYNSDKIERLEKEIEKLQKEVIKLKSQILTSRHTVEGVTAELKEQKELKSKLAKELEALGKAKAVVEAELQDLRRQQQEQQSRGEEKVGGGVDAAANGEEKEEEEEEEDVQGVLIELQGVIDSLKANLQGEMEKRLAAEGQLENARAEVQQLSAKVAELQEEITALKAPVVQPESSEVQGLKEQVVSLTSERDQLQAQLEELHSVEEEKTKLAREAQEANQRATALSAEHEKALHEMEVMRKWEEEMSAALGNKRGAEAYGELKGLIAKASAAEQAETAAPGPPAPSFVITLVDASRRIVVIKNKVPYTDVTLNSWSLHVMSQRPKKFEFPQDLVVTAGESVCLHWGELSKADRQRLDEEKYEHVISWEGSVAESFVAENDTIRLVDMNDNECSVYDVGKGPRNGRRRSRPDFSSPEPKRARLSVDQDVMNNGT